MPDYVLPEGMYPVEKGDRLIDTKEERKIVVEEIDFVLDGDTNRVASRRIKATYPPESPAHEHVILEGESKESEGSDFVVGDPGDVSFRYWWHGKS